jgi:hypothetical protein
VEDEDRHVAREQCRRRRRLQRCSRRGRCEDDASYKL